LDEYTRRGVVAGWWDSTQYDLRTLSSQGFRGLVDSWITTLRAVLNPEIPADDDSEAAKRAEKARKAFDPREHKVVRAMLPDYIARMEALEAELADLEAAKAAFEAGEDADDDAPVDPDDEDVTDYAKELRDMLKDLKKLAKTDKSERLAAEMAATEAALEPYNATKREIRRVKQALKALEADLLRRAEERQGAMGRDDFRGLVLTLFYDDLHTTLDRYIDAHRREVTAAVETWWDKYRVSLADIEAARDDARSTLRGYLREMGYYEH
jgi:type I restriction enzyme M protein